MNTPWTEIHRDCVVVYLIHPAVVQHTELYRLRFSNPGAADATARDLRHYQYGSAHRIRVEREYDPS